VRGDEGVHSPMLSLGGLNKRYGALKAVDDLSLGIREGEILGLLGPNGAGKTTTILMVCGLLKPDSGTITLRGKPVDARDRRTLARIGYCPQSIVLWPKLTCLEQLEFIGRMYGVQPVIARRRCGELLETVGLVEKRDRLAATLSGGMQRRLNLIMGLVHDPELLLLDEPEAGLDPQSRILVRDYIRGWARERGRTVVLTTHNMDEADRMSNRVAIIDHGKLLLVDTPEALKREMGEGDVLEIDLLAATGATVEAGLAAVRGLVPQAALVGHTIVARAPNLISLLPRLTGNVLQAGLKVGEVRLRENSLEDVFISLTGRRLRE